MKNYPYKISCVMAVYNVEKYIEDAIESVLSQTIGFEKNVQLILVNDGSTDTSGEKCDKYKEKYPDNVVVIHKQNEGVAQTRNVGKEMATGEFVTFLDPDDMISKRAMKNVYTYFSSVKEKTDIVAIPIYYFEAKKGNYPLNYKFKNKKDLISLNEVPDTILFGSVATFYKLETINKYSFLKGLRVSEDFRFNYEIFKESPKLGMVKNAKYLYRKRQDQSSLIQTRWNYKDTFVPCLENVYMYLMNEYSKSLGVVPKFLQHAIMFDLQYFINRDLKQNTIFGKGEITEFEKEVEKILMHIDNNIIATQNVTTNEQKIKILKLKLEITSEMICSESNQEALEIHKLISVISKKEENRKLKIILNIKRKIKRLLVSIYFKFIYDLWIKI